MEPEGSILNSQELSTWPYPELDQCSAYRPKARLRLGLPSGLFPSGIPTSNLYVFLFSPYFLHAPAISPSYDSNVA
jgi:hypothetical protein